MIKRLIPLLLILGIISSCYKEEFEMVDYNRYHYPIDSSTYTIVGGGYNDTVTTYSINVSEMFNPYLQLHYTMLGIGMHDAYDGYPEFEIFLTDHAVGTYVINGNTNRAYIRNADYTGDAFKGSISITESAGTEYHVGAYDLTFRDNALNPKDTIRVIGTFIHDTQPN